MKHWIIAALVAAVATGGALGALAATQTAGRVFEVRVWQSVEEPERHYVSIRAEGGDWRDAGTRPVTLTETLPTGRYRYGDLTVALSAEAAAPGQPALGKDASSGHWSISRLYDAIYDEETVSAITAPGAVLDKVWTGSLVDEPYLQVYCRGDELQALVYWDKSIFAPVIHNPVPTIRSVPTVWRVDGEAPVEERWLPATHGMATFPQYPAAFVSRLLGGETLIMRAIPANGERHTVTFNVTGLAAVLGNLTCYAR